MVKVILFHLIFIVISKIILSEPSCREGENYCSKCHPITKLCLKCSMDIYEPNENGECTYARKCKGGNHHCLECDEEGKMCVKCEELYYPDDNGCCAFTNNCEISYEGRCIKCKDDFILIGKNDTSLTNDEITICKSLNSEDLKNCKEIDIENGLCQECNEGYYLGSEDNKCTLTNYCSESTFGVCTRCIHGFYLDKTEQKCFNQVEAFVNCKESLDGKACDVCDEDFYLTKGICNSFNYCEEVGENNECKKCINGYYPAIYGGCTTEKNCYHGDKDLGICLQCNEHYCIDFKDGKCKYNLDDNELKYCQIADGKCTKCEEGYELSQDGKCSFSKHCFESDLGLCYECEDNYYLGLDNRCTDIEHCAYSDENQVCLECDEKYFYNKVDKNCTPAEGKFEHCKSGNFTDYCDTCQKDYYLSGKDFLCYDNTQPGPFYKCAYSDSNQERCTGCIDDYYLGHFDSKCSAIEGCEMSENENKCLECDEYHCLNLKNNLCYSNQKIKSEEEQFYYNCNQTNK